MAHEDGGRERQHPKRALGPEGQGGEGTDGQAENQRMSILKTKGENVRKSQVLTRLDVTEVPCGVVRPQTGYGIWLGAVVRNTASHFY